MSNLGNLLTQKDIEQWFERKEGESGQVNLTFSRYGVDILHCTGVSDDIKIILKEKNETINKSIFLSGLYDFRISITVNGNSENIATDDNNFDKNFYKAITNGILVPDTNFLIDHTLYALKTILAKQKPSLAVRVMIPRLAILELEHIANRRNDLKKRKAMYGFNEITNLRSDGADLLGLKLDRGTHEGFTRLASEKQTDSWIRREIHDLKDRKVKFGYEDEVIFCTSDQISSLSAIAENIDTLNVTKHENYGEKPRRSNLKQLAKLATTLSIFYKNISIDINGQKGVLTGYWEGKSNTDWIKNKVFYKGS